mgnify:CR=1 FL=1
MLKKLARVNVHGWTTIYLFTLGGYFFPTNMVTLALSWLRMRKQSGKTTVPLDAVPERRTERCSPRFRPGGRFWGEPRFRYLSPGSEGEKCRPLDHRRQIPFIHSARLIHSSKFNIYRAIFQLFPPCGRFKCTLVLCIFGNGACTLQKYAFQGSEPMFKSCWVPYGTCWCVLAHDKCHLRMRICWKNEMVVVAFLCSRIR